MAFQENDLPMPEGAFYVIERPAAEGVPELIRILDEDEGNSDDSYVDVEGEDDAPAFFGHVVLYQDQFFYRYQNLYDEEDETSDSSYEFENLGPFHNWVSDDSGYESMLDEDFEDEENHVLPQALTPPVLELQEDHQHPEFPEFHYPGRISPFGLWDLQESFEEDSDPSASPPSTFSKRCREESDEVRPTSKRPRMSCEGSLGEEEFSPEPSPSTSGFGFL
ncbi:uncharacterized protein ACNS7B_015126 [Menidia menidia]